MKTVNDKNQIWFERNNNIVTVGFTKSFLDSLDQCWHILPANLQRFREKAPLMVVETNDSLISVLSPVSAHFAQWSDKAQNFPYKLTEEDVVLEMNMTEARRTPGRAATVNVRVPNAARWVVDEANGIAAAADFDMPEPPRTVGGNLFAEGAALNARVVAEMQAQAQPAIRRRGDQF